MFLIYEKALSDIFTRKHSNTKSDKLNNARQAKKNTPSLMISEISIEIIYHDIYCFIFFRLITNV